MTGIGHGKRPNLDKYRGSNSPPPALSSRTHGNLEPPGYGGHMVWLINYPIAGSGVQLPHIASQFFIIYEVNTRHTNRTGKSMNDQYTHPVLPYTLKQRIKWVPMLRYGVGRI